MILKGFKFGMLLQFAIGPVCIYIFQMASLKGFFLAETGVLGVALIDGLFIFAAIFGMAVIIEKRNVKLIMKFFGAAILFFFGISTILGQFNIDILPVINVKNISNSTSVFGSAALLTASNPLTILFWAGVFSVKIAEENLGRNEIYKFGFGALLSTAFFLTLIAFLGNFAKIFMSADIIKIFNIMVGVLLIYFSFRMVVKGV